MKTEQEVQQLVSEANHCNNLDRLNEIRAALEKISAWVEARGVERKIERLERQYEQVQL